MPEAETLFEFDGPEPVAHEGAMFELFHEWDHRFAAKDPKAKRKLCKHCGRGKQNPQHWGAPPSMNIGGSGFNFQAYQGIKHKWQEIFANEMDRAGVPKNLGRVTAEGRVCFPDRHTRDQGNYRYLIEKALGDALTEGGWLVPSTPGADDDDCFFPVVRYEFGGLTATYEKNMSWTRIMLFTDSMPGGIV